MSPVSGNCKGSTLQDEWLHDEVLSATNRDGSAVKVVVRIHPKNDQRVVKIYFRAAPGGPMVLVDRFEQPLSYAPPVGALIIDWDKDGENEIEIVSDCGAGPNCESTIYRVDKNKNALRLFFQASGADVELIDGYLVESERDSCCAWIFSAHKFARSRQWVNPEASFFAIVEAVDKDGDKSTCTFYIHAPDGGRQTINPPSKALLKVCHEYGEGYVVIQPPKRQL